MARVRVRVPETGALLRWLLGLGDNVEVVAPAELRRVVGEQAHKVARHYPRLNEQSEEAGAESDREQTHMTVETPTR